ncbi:MAG: NAD-dependent dihydropyrimidine dehydrogenase subunit PreA, partial [Deinococcales bacterium]
IPIIIKLTPNITDICDPAKAAVRGGAPAVSLINTINSIIGVDLETFAITPNIGGKGGHGGYAGPAVKPIALNMLSSIASLQELQKAGTKISGMGGISTWKDAAEFLLLGAHSLQVCTAVMHYGYRLIEDLCDGLSNWLDDKGYNSVNQIIGASVSRISQFNDFDLSYRVVAEINQDKCIQCNLCYVACNDTAHQCIDLYSSEGLQVQPYTYDLRDNGKHNATQNRAQPVVREEDCVGCALCYNVCPVDNCITMVERPSGRDSVTWREISEKMPEVATDWAAMKRYRAEKGIDIH